MAQTVKNLSAMWETWVRSLGQEDTWRREWLPTPVFLGSFVAQLVKNLVAMQQTWVRSLDWEDPLDKGKANHSRILSWRIPWTVESTASQELYTTERLSLC